MEFRSSTVAVIVCAILLQTCLTTESAYEADRIVSLPGQPNVSFQQFAGYVTIDEKQKRALFYYFVEAESDPASKPLVLWLNGGPGCSSVGFGAFSEHGPFRPSGDILVRNNYSWNKEANMLYLESPAGVGFSYSANSSFYNHVNDTITAWDNLVFLQLWFDKFPQYKNRDFFITGESYAGHYVPQLAQLIVESNVKFNLKGIAIGNPLLEFDSDLNSQGEYYWSHGLISDSTFKLVNSVCNISQLQREAIGGHLSLACSTVYGLLSKEISGSIDGYDVTANICLTSSQSQLGISKHPLWFGFRHSFSLASQAEVLSQSEPEENIDLCVQVETFKYLNRKDVQAALHSRLVGVSQWGQCSRVVQYDDHNLEIPTIHVLGSLVHSGIRVLVYSGDQDSVIPFMSSRTLVSGLAMELGLKATVPYRAWLLEKQVGGWTQVYGDILSYATIRGGSHVAPFSSPGRSLALFAAFLEGKPLSDSLTH